MLMACSKCQNHYLFEEIWSDTAIISVEFCSFS